MTVKRFFGDNAREALRKVKAALGSEAIVISNKPVPGGVEIMAMSADSLDALSQMESSMAQDTPYSKIEAAKRQGQPLEQAATPAAPRRAELAESLAPRAMRQPEPPTMPQAPAPAQQDEQSDYAVSLSAKARAPQPFQPWPPRQVSADEYRVTPSATTEAAARQKPRPLPPKAKPAARQAAPAPSQEQVAASLDQVKREIGMVGKQNELENNPQVQTLMAEMQSIKSMLERQLAGFAWGEMTRQSPVKAQLLAEMLEAGFSGMLSRRLADELPEEMQIIEGRKWLTTALSRRLRTLSSENDMIEHGGVFALLGPTGVGKTTTTAKLAARCVVRYGADKLALLTTDGYRIGAHEQLRIYGRILGVPVHVVRDSEDLRRTLMELRGKHMVLIDTVGMSQRDRMVAEQAAMLTRAGDVRRLLLLNATSRGDTLDDVVRNYAGEDFAGCIITKVDEAASLAPALDVVVRHGLLLSYVANGQRVPEDLHLPNRKYLLHRALKQPAAESVHRLKEEEIGLVVPAAKPARRQGASFV